MINYLLTPFSIVHSVFHQYVVVCVGDLAYSLTVQLKDDAAYKLSNLVELII